MKLSKLQTQLKKFADRQQTGKKVKAAKLREVLDELKKKGKKIETDYMKERSAKAKQKLELRLKVVTAQIKKGQKLLKQLES